MIAVARPTASEPALSLSADHGLTVERTAAGQVLARQINGRVDLSPAQTANLVQAIGDRRSDRFSVPTEHMPRLMTASLASEHLIAEPLPVIFLSSHGLLNRSRWSSSQPSDGIWLLAEWLSRRVAVAAPCCIDPNLITTARLDEVLASFAGDRRILVGYSALPVNLQNDVALICHVKELLPQATLVVGGIGSEALSWLPTASGRMGIETLSVVDAVIPGPAVLELEAVTRALFAGEVRDGAELRRFLSERAANLYLPEEWQAVQREIQRARVTAKTRFIPNAVADLFHRISYQQANAASVRGKSQSIATVLINNECDQGCFFCASPKTKLFGDIESAVDHIEDKARHSAVIAFNDNDLSNDPAWTSALCAAMHERGIRQPKHGKMRADRYLPELLDGLAAAGFVRIAVGVESFSAAVRNRLGKANFSRSSVAETLEHLLRVGITPEINLIVFAPNESDETLRETIEESLYWADRGCSLYVTFGLFATPNSPGVLALLRRRRRSAKIHYEEIFHPGMSEAVHLPVQWRVSTAMTELKERLLAERETLVEELRAELATEISVPVEAYLAVGLMAHHFGLSGWEDRGDTVDRLRDYARARTAEEYVSI